LNVTFASNFNDVAIDELTVRVVLPEGATQVDFVTPFPVDSHSFDTHFTYLDTSGRPVLIIKKSNVVPEHNKYFQVLYRFSQTSLLREPVLLIGAFFLLFAFVLLYSRLPLSVGEAKANLGPNSDRILGALVHLKEVSEQRNELHEALTEAVANYVKSKNDKAWTTARKVTESTLNNLNKDLNSVVAELEEVAADIGKRAREVLKKLEKKTQLQSSLVDLEVSYKVRKVVEKSSYDAQKAELEKQYKILEDEVESAISDLTDNL
jgi:oligosaccharyltransferase complex subunit alpha (ribophorin I)